MWDVGANDTPVNNGDNCEIHLSTFNVWSCIQIIRMIYISGPVNSNTVNRKLHLSQTFYLSLLFHV